MINDILRADVPVYLKRLFDFDKKSSLEKYCKDLVIKKGDFAKLIINSYKIGYSHSINYNDFLPEHLNPTADDFKAFDGAKVGERLTGSAKKAANKMTQIFEQRRYLVTHIFWNEDKWHLFYFDQRDMEYRFENHWKKGSHIHFINYLWPNLDPSNVWAVFNKANGSVGGKLHIKYDPEEED